MRSKTLSERLRAFWDFLVLFSGVSTASNLSRTRRDPVQSSGLFLFRRPYRDTAAAQSGQPSAAPGPASLRSPKGRIDTAQSPN